MLTGFLEERLMKMPRFITKQTLWAVGIYVASVLALYVFHKAFLGLFKAFL